MLAARLTAAADQSIRVFLLDDHEIVRRGLVDLLEGDGMVVAAGQSLLDPAVTGKLLDRLRTPPVTEDPRVGSLNPREREILDLIAGGLSNREIGERLFLAEKTVKNNVSGLLAKLQMRRRTQAAVLGTELGRR